MFCSRPDLRASAGYFQEHDVLDVCAFLRIQLESAVAFGSTVLGRDVTRRDPSFQVFGQSFDRNLVGLFGWISAYSVHVNMSLGELCGPILVKSTNRLLSLSVRLCPSLSRTPFSLSGISLMESLALISDSDHRRPRAQGPFLQLGEPRRLALTGRRSFCS